MSRWSLKPGDLIHVIHSKDHPVAREHIGKIGVIVKLKYSHPTAMYEVLLVGGIGHFYHDSLEVIDETG